MSKEELPSPLASPEYQPPDGDPHAHNPHVLASNIAQLEGALSEEKEERREERFYWAALCSLLMDVAIYIAMDGGWGFALIFMLQIIILIGFAKKNGVDWAVELLSWFLDWLARRSGSK